MTVTELVAEVTDAWMGDSDSPTDGSDEWNYILRIANRKLRQWARDKNRSWSSLYEERTFGTVSSGTQTYDLDEDVHKLSDFVYVDINDTQYAEYKVVRPNQRGEHFNSVFLTGPEGAKVLHFYDSIVATSTVVGGTIRAGVYILPEPLASANDDVLIDSPDWLVLATAAEAARNDPAKDDQYSNLITAANDEYETMVLNNLHNPHAQPGGVRVDLPTIGNDGSW